MAGNQTFATLPPLPSYTTESRENLLPWIDDKTLTVVSPIIAYWVVSLFWHAVDELDLFPSYRLHTPAEILKRNHAGRWEVFRDVIVQQIIQTIVGMLLNMTEPDDVIGREEYDVAVWAQRIRLAQRVIPASLGLFGVDAAMLSKQFAGTHPMLAGAIAGGNYPSLIDTGINGGQVPRFAGWEMTVARATYSYIFPTLQFFVAILFVDTWQYFLHRAMHMNRWLYTTFHSRHHRLYVPYAYGALYNHPVEGFVLDTLGAGIAFKVAGLSIRQGGCFFVGSTIKTVDDHCGYHLPWDPLQLLTSNNASYHDVHHQSWGIKSNFSQPFFTFWDRLLETKWTGGDVSAKYERARVAAQKKVEEDEKQARALASASSSPASSLASDGMKGLRGRVSGKGKGGGSGHGRKGSLLGVEH